MNKDGRYFLFHDTNGRDEQVVRMVVSDMPVPNSCTAAHSSKLQRSERDCARYAET